MKTEVMLSVGGSRRQIAVEDWLQGYVAVDSLFEHLLFPKVFFYEQSFYVDSFLTSPEFYTVKGRLVEEPVQYFGNRVFIHSTLIQYFYEYVDRKYKEEKEVYSMIPRIFKGSHRVSLDSPPSRNLLYYFNGFVTPC